MTTALIRPRSVGAPRAAGRFGLPVVLSRLLAGLVLTGGLLTFADPGILTGPDVMVGSARGTGLVLALLGAPLLVTASERARRGSARAVVVWLGTLGYVVYNAVLLLFATPANPLLPVYTTTLGLALLTLVVTVLAAHPLGLRVEGAFLRPFAVFLWVFAALNAVLWLLAVGPGLAQEHPDYLAGTGLGTNPVYVQDLAVWLPLAGLAGWWLWRGRPAGVLVGGAYLAGWVAESVGVAADQWMGGRADPSSTVASSSMTLPFLALGVVQLAVLVLFLRTCRRSSEP